jgi:hypothetical protein
MLTVNCAQGPQSSAIAPVILAAKLASIGTTSRCDEAAASRANLKKARGDSVSM